MTKNGRAASRALNPDKNGPIGWESEDRFCGNGVP